jgi:hypothetical protein
MILLAFGFGCGKGGEPVAQKPAESNARPATQATDGPASSLDKAPIGTAEALKDLNLPPGLDLKDSARSAEALPEGSGSADDHPVLAQTDKVERDVVVPEALKGKWKAVKLQVRNKKNEKANELKITELGSTFNLQEANTKLKVTVGPFLPNFVMSKTSYTSINNELTNPAVQLTVEENGKVVYKGWAFAKYPTLYAFEHDVFSFQLMDFVPVNVS